MSLHTIPGMLNVMRSQLNAIGSQTDASSSATLAGTTDTPSFSSLLRNSLNAISQTQTQATQNAEGYLSGVRGTSLNDAMIALQKSSLSLNFGVQVRNKLVGAYQDIMNMSV